MAGNFLFYLFAGITLLMAVGVIVNRNPVSSALCLVSCFVGLAALFVQLEAFFIAVIQILVYAGAVMVLFLFIIMLMDFREEKRRKLNYVAFGGGAALIVLFVAQLLFVLSNFSEGKKGFALLNTEAAVAQRLEASGGELDPADTATRTLQKEKLPDVFLVGETLFKEYNFPLQIVGILLLVSTVGVVILSKRKLT